MAEGEGSPGADRKPNRLLSRTQRVCREPDDHMRNACVSVFVKILTR
jgi:hypothetical protein